MGLCTLSLTCLPNSLSEKTFTVQWFCSSFITTSKILNKMQCQPPEALKSSEEMQITECNLACMTPNPWKHYGRACVPVSALRIAHRLYINETHGARPTSSLEGAVQTLGSKASGTQGQKGLSVPDAGQSGQTEEGCWFYKNKVEHEHTRGWGPAVRKRAITDTAPYPTAGFLTSWPGVPCKGHLLKPMFLPTTVDLLGRNFEDLGNSDFV